MIIEIPDDNSNIKDLISREDLIRAIKTECNPYGAPTIDYKSGLRVLEIIERAPTVAESCKELHEVATERPQTIGCFNCKYDTKMLCEEPCKFCNFLYSEWRQKE